MTRAGVGRKSEAKSREPFPLPAAAFLFVAGLIALSILINLMSFKPGHDWGDDYAGYVLQSKTIASGDFQGLERHIGNTELILNYPWGFPLILSPVIGYFDDHIRAVKFYVYIFFILALLVFHRLIRGEATAAAFTLLLIAVNPYFWDFKNSILADFPHLFFCFLSLLLIDFVVVKKRLCLNALMSNLLLGTSIFLTYFVRNQSILLLLVLLLMQVLTRKAGPRERGTFPYALVPYAVFLGLAVSSSLLIPVSSTSYLGQYDFHAGFLLKTVLRNGLYYAAVWKELFQGVSVVSRFSTAFAAALLIPATMGIRNTFKKMPLLAVFFAIHLGMMLITPFHQGLRYIMPLAPIYFYYVVNGTGFLCSKCCRRSGRTAYYAFVGLLFAASFRTIFLCSLANFRAPVVDAGAYRETSREMLSFIRSRSRPEDRIAFFKPRAMLLHGCRDGIFPSSIQHCRDRRADYLVYCKYAGEGQLSWAEISRHQAELQPVFSNDDFVIFRMAGR